ncbi:hypothetical protein DFH09DRAFT_1096438 [Mycena vulgaris]|nr:hypothetical protein DFH09DRAFT_1096438 [Mycena vulgaris]
MSNLPHSFNYDNLNISTSIFVEQRGAAGPAKVQSGTFGILYKLRNAHPEHMLTAPIMKRFKASKGIEFNRDIKPSLDHLSAFHDQLVIVIIHSLLAHVDGFSNLVKDPRLQHTARRPIPAGYTTDGAPVRATTIPEATVRDNLLYHDDVYINQLERTREFLNTYAIPGFHDQLTNARIRSTQILRAQDIDPCVNDAGSLSYFFALMEKVRLGNDQPDYHSLLAALTQVLDGLLLNAWRQECGFSSFKTFVDAKSSPEKLRKIAARILTDYATPMSASHSPESTNVPPTSDSDSDSTADSDSEGAPVPPASSTGGPRDDIAHQNLRVLTRDLLMVAVVVRAISDGDIGRVEVLLPHLAMMFRGSGCNKYCTEILHFIHNLKHIWTPEFAYDLSRLPMLEPAYLLAFRDIMRDNMIICISGLGPDHCMAIDMNIEHLIGYLKGLLQAKGMSSTWDRLDNISAAIISIQRVKKKISSALDAPYRNTGHTTPDTSEMVWRVQRKVANEENPSRTS